MAYDVARYLSIEAVDTPSFTVDGDLLCLADTSGTPQVWRLGEGGAWPERLTPYEERVSTVAASPTRPEFVFGMDRDSDERDQLFRYDLADGEIHRLTDDPESTHQWGAWSPDGERLAFAANREETGRFDVYVQDRAGGDPELVHEGPGGWLSVAAWGPDGRRLALLSPRSSTNVDLSVLDVETGETRRFGADEAARFSHVHFDSRGSSLLLVTDFGRDRQYVGRVDLDTGAVDPLPGAPGSDPANADGGAGTADPATWPVDGLAVHRASERLAVTRNVDGYSHLHTGYLDEGRFVENAAPDVSDGVVSSVAFGTEGRRYAVAYSDATTPKGIHVATFGTDTDERYTPVGTCGVPDAALRAPEVVRYETFDVDDSQSSSRETESPGRREIPAYWTLPADAEPGATPAIVDVHGGPSHQRRPWFHPEKQYFLDRGYAVLEPNVRGSTGYGREYAALDDVERRLDSVDDVAAGVEWLADTEFVDPDRVVAYGRSYGGFVVLSAITRYPELWAAAVEFVGIANFVTFLENTGDWRRSHREAEYGSLDDDRDLLEEISPIHDVDAVECPLFVQHGANDPRVPVEESEAIAERLRERGVPVETCIFEDEGHHTTDRANRIEQFERVADFLDEHV
jgi:dipeptidyl aminopeptidase/acylaminoacyl peptidase